MSPLTPIALVVLYDVAVLRKADNSLLLIEIKVGAIEKRFIGSSSVVPMNKSERKAEINAARKRSKQNGPTTQNRVLKFKRIVRLQRTTATVWEGRPIKKGVKSKNREKEWS